MLPISVLSVESRHDDVTTQWEKIVQNSKIDTKAELLKVGIFFLIHLFAREILLLKSWKLKKRRPPSIQLLKLI